MILVLTAQAESQHEDGRVVQRQAETADQVLGWLENESVEQVVLVWPPPQTLNPFALSRALRRVNGPRLVIAGAPRADQQFWAERNGCLLATDLTDALTKE